MTWAAPAALGWLALMLLIISFFLLRPTRQRIVVASILVWRTTVHRRTSDTWLAWLRRYLLLLLQLAIVVVLTLALARPENRDNVALPPPVALVIDISASMGTTKDGRSRLDLALDKARDFVRSLDSEQRVSVISAGAIPQALVAQEIDRPKIQQALDSIKLEISDGQIVTALDVALSLADPSFGGTVAFFTDSGFADQDNPRYAPVRTILIGTSAKNVVLETFNVRRELNDPSIVQGLVVIRNDGPYTTTANVTLDTYSSISPFHSATIGPGEREIRVFDDLPSASRYQASLSVLDDSLVADNIAIARLDDSPAINVIVVGENHEPIVRALQATNSISAVGIGIQAFNEHQGDGDLSVFQGFVPQSLPTASVLFVQPPPIPEFNIDKPIKQMTTSYVNPESPLFRSIDVLDVLSGTNLAYTTPKSATSDAGTEKRSVVAHGIVNGRRTIVIGFDVVSTHVSQAPWYPILWTNIARWANPSNPLPDGVTVDLNRPAQLVPHPNANRIAITAPSGVTHEFNASKSPVLDVDSQGSYIIQQFNGETLIAETMIDFRASFAAPVVTPNPDPPPHGPVVSILGPVDRTREAWPLFASVALGLLLVEWFTFYRFRGVR